VKFVGVDLAGNPKNETGFCVLDTVNSIKRVSTTLLHSDDEIIDKIMEISPVVTAIDAPLTFNGVERRCDRELRRYGALPVTLRGMEILAIRGSELARKLMRLNMNVIEVFSTATAKILGLYASSEREMQKNLIDAGISGDVDKRFLTRDELDAIFAAITAYLYINKSTTSVGDDKGRIIIPRV